MITLKRYLLTLVALLAMTTGAWAGGTISVVGSFTNWDLTANDMAYADGIFSITFSNVSAGDKQFKFAVNHSWDVAYGATTGDAVELDKTHEASTTGDDIKFTLNEASNVTISFMPGETATYMISTTGLLVGQTPALMTLSSDGLTATMAAMPAYDATVSYELVRDLAQGVAFSGLPEGDGCILKKDGDKYTFATAPTIALEDNISGTAQAITAEGITLSYEKKGEGDTWVAQPDDFDIAIDAVPGTYRVVATATTGLYDGTLYSPEFTLAEAYDLTLSPATDANLQSVTVAGTAKTADENGVIRGIEPTKKVKITTTGPDYIIRKAAVKKTEAGPITVTITQSDFADGASFTKDGVTVAANRITASTGDIESDGSFSTTLGKFTQIVVNSSFVSNASGTGWSGSGQTITWSGTPASTVTFNGSFVGMGQGITIVCTIQPGN